jgi:metal-sulfur cluster biosynthetic enzyme
MASAGPRDVPGFNGASYPTDPLWDALREVPDPELGISVVDMGLVVDVRRAGDHVTLRITYTAMGCPATEMIEEDARARLLAVPGVRAVTIEVVWDPIWTKARLTVDGRDALLAEGIAV